MASSCEHHLNVHRECDISSLGFLMFFWIIKYFLRNIFRFIEIYFGVYYQVSLGVFSHEGRHNATYTAHVPMKEPLTVVPQPACLGKFPYRPPGSRCSPYVSPPGYFVN